MMAQKLPFDATSMEALLRAIIRGVHNPLPRVYSQELRNVSPVCLEHTANFCRLGKRFYLLPDEPLTQVC